MSSREISKLTGKEHKHVKRDIDVMAKELNLSGPDLGGSEYTCRGNTYTEYNLDKNLTLTLISGYNVKLRNTIVTRWDELEVENKELVAQLQAHRGIPIYSGVHKRIRCDDKHQGGALR